MIPTYTFAIKQELLSTFFGTNLVVALINQPSLGITNTPTNQQLVARANIETLSLFSTEIGGINLNGYARQIITSMSINELTNQISNTNLSVNFTADGGDFNPFSHIVLIKNADLTNADPILNGNNRGSTLGTIIYVEPVNNLSNPGQPLILQDGLTFTYNFSLAISSEVI